MPGPVGCDRHLCIIPFEAVSIMVIARKQPVQPCNTVSNDLAQ